MLSKTLKKMLAGVLAGAALLASAIPAQAADFDLNLVFLANTDDEDYDGALVFKDWVESRSNGSIGVTIYPGGQICGNPRECIEALQDGLVHIFITTIGGFGNIFPEAQVMDLPYMFRDDRVAECALNGPFVGELRKATLDITGGTMRLMTIGNTGGWRNFATVDKQIKAPADVEGLKIRTISSELQQELVKGMGGSPTPVSWGELYTSLATGVVSGTKNGITDIVGMKFHEHLKNITLDGHAYMGALWWMNNETYESMSPELRRVITDGFDRLRLVTLAMPQRRQLDAYEAFKEAGGTIYVPTPAEKAKFKEAAAPVWNWYKEKFGDEWLNKLSSAVKDCETKLDAEYGNL